MKIETLFFGDRWANTYLLTDDNGECAAVDPGAPTPRLIEMLEGRGVKYILLTHGHFDHIASVPALREKTGAKVLIHPLDAPMTEDSDRNLSAHALGRALPPFTADRLIEDGEILDFGGLKVLHTPGHTPGSVCFVGDNFIISGDTLFAGGIGRTDFPGGSLAEMTASLKKLVALSGDYGVYPGHGGATTLETERNENYYIRMLLQNGLC